MLMDEETKQRKKIESVERTSVLANERTYAAWVRTGLASIIAGLGTEKFLIGLFHANIIHIISFITLSFGATCFFLAAWRYHHVEVRLKSSSVSGAPTELLMLLSALLIFATIMAFIGVWTEIT